MTDWIWKAGQSNAAEDLLLQGMEQTATRRFPSGRGPDWEGVFGLDYRGQSLVTKGISYKKNCIFPEFSIKGILHHMVKRVHCLFDDLNGLNDVNLAALRTELEALDYINPHTEVRLEALVFYTNDIEAHFLTFEKPYQEVVDEFEELDSILHAYGAVRTQELGFYFEG